ncbi:MAG TPA: ABC transporter permease [Coriobacteriia bacterium]|nr:ABC transporter permease [Coriobacteriia bacterium]
MLGIWELVGNKLKFGLIAAAIGLIVSLTFIMASMSEGLVTGMTGAARALDADALVFQGDTFLALERSRLTADDIEAVSRTEGVASAYGVGHAFISIDAPDEAFNARAFGLGGRFDQLPIVEGVGTPGPGEAIVDVTAKENGVRLGDTLELTPIGEELVVVGFTEGRRYVMTPGVFVDLPTWERIFAATALGQMRERYTGEAPGADRVVQQIDGSVSVAAVDLEPGTTVEELAADLAPQYDVATPQAAAMASNGMTVMMLAVNGIQGVSLAISALVIGVFFFITTLNKTGQIAALKALGASNGFVYRQLLVQITLLVAVASAIGITITFAMGASMPPAMAFDPQPVRWAVALVSVFAMAYLGSLFSLRSILAIDPATALDRAEH